MRGYRVRLARPDELAALPAIEEAAGGLFRQTAYPWIADPAECMSLDHLAACQDSWNLWVAAGADDRPVGFAAFAQYPDQSWLGELSVHPEHAGRRLGAALIEAGARFYGGRGSPRMTLTTFRDVPWNAPYYARLGFSIVEDLSAEARLAEQVSRELAWGVPEGSRVAMVRRLN